MMLYCINIAHTESQGREVVDFEGRAREGVLLFRLRGAAEAHHHITLVNALPSGSECGSVYAIKITFNCAFAIVGCQLHLHSVPADRPGATSTS
ncbi:Hypothetical predicted protein [Cloeon dipterum]|uniref:Uncharacterized protein n=1 Tax=Cloeon dipterum TaxID=197152 RepID=A0A8S1CBH8_9INSE|nr:Hypothetical predicted protein [Cloeon dipterum]